MLPYPKLRIFLLRLSLLLALAPFVALMAYTQPFFDDFRNAYWTREHGLWGVQQWLFQTWTGRFTSTFFMTVLNPVTYGWLGGVKVVAAGLFVGLWASLAHLLRVLFGTLLRVAFSWSMAFWCSAVLLALFCNAAPAPFSFLYWFCGAVAYQIPFIGLLNFTALAVLAGWGPAEKQWRYAGWACVPLLLALVGNELTLLQALPVLALLGYAMPAAARPKWWLWAVVGGAAAALALAAPGNWARAQAMAPPTDPLHAYRWLVLGPRSLYSALLFMARPMVAFSVAAAVLSGLWLGYRHRGTGAGLVRLSRRGWLLVLAAFGALNGLGFVLFRYVVVGPPLTRAQNEMLLVLLLSVAALAWLVAQQLPRHPGRATRCLRSGTLAVALMAGLFGTGHVPEAWRELLTSAKPFDAQMKARFAALRAAHAASTFIDFDIDLTPGCDGTINGVMERYFEVPRVCCSPEAPSLPAPK
ncbi:hypothetical protein BEN48_05065 [Hymenobacter glacialis]|uniref:Glycosyltransferase RgtA/B/C/D-like domain-containing protein n=1 Tax=Hymenobacter glacialis TaxID=1908236 RepID=A0A1G1SUP0_9BACT|nr:hypothetical protein BEN48_05065 [Hymenobacter glacialis]